MVKLVERLGVRMLSRFVPAVNASAAHCLCEVNHWWCCDGPYWNYCYCEQHVNTCYIMHGYTYKC